MTLSVAVLMDPIGRSSWPRTRVLPCCWKRNGAATHCFTWNSSDLALRDGMPWARIAPLAGERGRTTVVHTGPATMARSARDGRGIAAQGPAGRRAVHLRHTWCWRLRSAAASLLVNDPRALRDCNEKLFALQFTQCIAPTLVSRDAAELRRFTAEHGESC